MPPRSALFIATTFAALVLHHVSGEGYAETFSDKDITGGVVTQVVATPWFVKEIRLREKGTDKTRRFFVADDLKPLVSVNGREANFKDLKTGMRVQVTFYRYSDFAKTFDDETGFPISRVKALSAQREEPPRH